MDDAGQPYDRSQTGLGAGSRSKPDFVANGQTLLTTINGPTFESFGNTLASTAVVSGVVALLIERFHQLNGPQVVPALSVKVILLQTASRVLSLGD